MLNHNICGGGEAVACQKRQVVEVALDENSTPTPFVHLYFPCFHLYPISTTPAEKFKKQQKQQVFKE